MIERQIDRNTKRHKQNRQKDRKTNKIKME